MILAHENKCAMCGKETVANDKSNKKKEQQQQENDLTSSLKIQYLWIYGMIAEIESYCESST
jgi:hypothetical protein